MQLKFRKVFSKLTLNNVSESVNSYSVEKIESNSNIRVGMSSTSEPAILISTAPCDDDESFPDQCLTGVQAKFFKICSASACKIK